MSRKPEWGRRRSDDQAYPKTRDKEALPTGLQQVVKSETIESFLPSIKRLVGRIKGELPDGLEPKIITVAGSAGRALKDKRRRWKKGSDIDIFIYGTSVSSEWKRQPPRFASNVVWGKEYKLKGRDVDVMFFVHRRFDDLPYPDEYIIWREGKYVS